MKKLLISNKTDLDYATKQLQEMFAKDGALSVEIKALKNKRTNPQLNYYWLCIRYICDHFNNEGNEYTEEQVSDQLKQMFYFNVINFAGKPKKSLKSISNKSDTDKKEMADFITKIIVWCNENQIILPECDYNIDN